MSVLHTIAANVMVHMKTVKEAHEKQRAIHMNMCMADFINPEHRFRSRQMRPYRFDSPHEAPSDGRDKPRASNSLQHTKPPEPQTNSLPNPAPAPDLALAPQSAANAWLSAPSRDLSRSPIPTPRSDSFISNEQHEYFDHDPITPLECPAETQEYEDTLVPTPFEERDVSLDVNTDTESQYTVGATVPEPLSEIDPESQSRPSPLSRGRSRQPISDSDVSTTSPRRPKNVTEADHQRTFDRAAYLLRQSLDLSQFGGGGVVLLDTNAGAESTNPMNKRHEADYGDIHAMTERPGMGPQQKSTSKLDQAESAYSGAMQERVVLAAASVRETSAHPKNYGRADPSWKVTLSPPELQRMCQRHPRGKLYDLPESVGTTLFDYEGRTVAGRLSAKLYELVLLRRQFPNAKQVSSLGTVHPTHVP